MQFDLNPEQQLLSDSVGRFIEKEYSFESRVRRLAGDHASRGETWRAFAEQGWLAAALPERYGGLGGTVIDTAIISRHFGRGLVLEPYLGCAVLAAQTLVAAASETQREVWLPGLADGSRRIALAFAEGAHEFIEPVTTNAERTQSGYVLTGRKSLVLGGVGADAYIVSACTGATGSSLFLVSASADGVQVAPAPLHDGRLAAELTLDGAAAELLGAEGSGLAALQQGLAHGIIALCAELVGSMERVIEITADYLRTRRQFDVPLASFQALQHRMADMAAELELARSMLFAALASFQNDEPGRRRDAGRRQGVHIDSCLARVRSGHPAARGHRHDRGIHHRSSLQACCRRQSAAGRERNARGSVCRFAAEQVGGRAMNAPHRSDGRHLRGSHDRQEAYWQASQFVRSERRGGTTPVLRQSD